MHDPYSIHPATTLSWHTITQRDIEKSNQLTFKGKKWLNSPQIWKYIPLTETKYNNTKLGLSFYTSKPLTCTALTTGWADQCPVESCLREHVQQAPCPQRTPLPVHRGHRGHCTATPLQQGQMGCWEQTKTYSIQSLLLLCLGCFFFYHHPLGLRKVIW